MVVVTKIEVMKCCNDPTVFYRIEPGKMIEISDRVKDKPYIHNNTELVKGQIFCDNNGREFHIGMTRDVAETLGTPFDVIQSQQDEIYQLTKSEGEAWRRHRVAIEEWSEWISMSFWNRCRFLVGLHPNLPTPKARR